MKTNDNQMAGHIRKTVAEIDGDILQLQADVERLRSMRTGLVDLYGGETEVAEPPANIVQTPRRAGKKTRGGSGKPAVVSAAGTSGRKPGPDYFKLMDAARTAAEPLTMAGLAKTTGLEGKFIANKLWKWMNKGFITKTGKGEFARADGFPAANE